jgi:hypothetical protein
MVEAHDEFLAGLAKHNSITRGCMCGQGEVYGLWDNPACLVVYRLSMAVETAADLVSVPSTSTPPTAPS